MNHKIVEETENLRVLKNKRDNLEDLTNDLVNTIQTLLKNRNNIAGRTAEIREELINQIGAKKEEIPFVGELLRVKETELKWESSIEKVLHNFALRLIVPPKYYSKVNKYVNTNNLRGRIRYDKYQEPNHLKNFQIQDINPSSLLNKVELKPNSDYNEWLEQNLDCSIQFYLYGKIIRIRNLFRNGHYSKWAN